MTQPTPFAMTGSGAPPPTGKGIWIGIVLMVVGVVGGAAMVVIGFVFLARSVDDRPSMTVPGRQAFVLDAGEYVLYGSDSANSIETVIVTGPNGDRLATSGVRGLQTATKNGKSFVGFATFAAPTNGTYQFEVSDTESSFSRSAEMMIGPDSFGLLGVTLGLVFGGIGIGGLLFVVGLTVMIVGVVKRSRGRRSTGSPPGAYRAGYGSVPPGYGPPRR